MANKIPTALVSDFDGTISDDDFFNYVSRRWLGEKALDPWREYTEGKKTHFEALREIFASLRVEQPAFDDFIREIKIDPGFFTVADYCRLFMSARPAATITSISWRERRWPTAG